MKNKSRYHAEKFYKTDIPALENKYWQDESKILCLEEVDDIVTNPYLRECGYAYEHDEEDESDTEDDLSYDNKIIDLTSNGGRTTKENISVTDSDSDTESDVLDSSDDELEEFTDEDVLYRKGDACDSKTNSDLKESIVECEDETKEENSTNEEVDLCFDNEDDSEESTVIKTSSTAKKRKRTQRVTYQRDKRKKR